VGVGEEVTLTFSGGLATWNATAGKLSVQAPNTADHVIWTAPDRAASPVTITATGAGCTATVSFNVVEPSGVRQQRNPGTGIKHTVNKPDSGMKSTSYYLPDDVCFYNIETLEDEVNAVDTGVYALMTDKGHHPSTTPSTCSMTVVAGLGTKENATDTVYSGYPAASPPYAPGSRTFNIPTKFCVAGGAWKQIELVVQQHVLANDGASLTSSKAGASTPTIKVADPTSNF